MRANLWERGVTLTVGSLFSGIGGFDLAAERVGMRVAWSSEIEPYACRVLAKRFPDVPNLGDVTRIENAPRVDVITFGSPCQDLSVAGRRAGFDGARSGLYSEAVRLIKRLRPEWAIWENVPGALSSTQGADFGMALDLLADAGALDLCWRVLDAQWFGVPQRRRRIFLVADFRGRRAYSVLFESSRGGRHSAPRRASGQRVAAPLTAGVAATRGVSAPGRRQEDDVNVVVASESGQGWWNEDVAPLRAEGDRPGRPSHLVVPETAHTLRGNTNGSGSSDNAWNSTYAVQLAQTGSNGSNLSEDVAPTLEGCARVAVAQALTDNGTDVAATLRAEYSEKAYRGDGSDGLVVQPVTARALTSHPDRQDGTVDTYIVSNGQGDPNSSSDLSFALDTQAPPAVYQCQGNNVGEMGTLRAGNGGLTGGVPFVADLAQITSKDNRSSVQEDAPSPTRASGSELVTGFTNRGTDTGKQSETLRAASHGALPMAFNWQAGGESDRQWITRAGDYTGALGSSRHDAVSGSFGIRRLMPVEAERLQGFPDGWTCLEDHQQPCGCADAPRYRCLGNAVAIPVAQWLLGRVAEAANR